MENYNERYKNLFSESINTDFRYYYAIDPLWMNVRLCIFWFLWATLIIVLIISVLSYCCLLPQTCTSSQKVIVLNETNMVSVQGDSVTDSV